MSILFPLLVFEITKGAPLTVSEVSVPTDVSELAVTPFARVAPVKVPAGAVPLTLPVTLPIKVPVTFPEKTAFPVTLIPWLKFHQSLALFQRILLFVEPLRIIPPPSELASDAEPELGTASSKVLSVTNMVSLFIVVVAPWTSNVPVTITSPSIVPPCKFTFNLLLPASKIVFKPSDKV